MIPEAQQVIDEMAKQLPMGWKFNVYKMANMITFELTQTMTGVTATWKRDEDFCLNYKGDLTALIIEECKRMIYGPTV